MSALLNIVLAIQILTALTMIGLILLQQGKGADMGAAFGSGSSGSLFGASGGANFMSRTTAGLAAAFFICTLILAYFGNLHPTTSSVLDTAAPTVTTPAAPTTGVNNAVTPNSENNKNSSGSSQIPTK